MVDPQTRRQVKSLLASVRERAPIFLRTEATCLRTVSGLIPSLCAICLSVSPNATEASTDDSRFESA